MDNIKVLARIVLCFIIFSIVSDLYSYDTEILYPDAKYNRKDMVYKKLLNIRLKSSKKVYELQSGDIISNAKIIKPFLEKSRTYTYLKMNNMLECNEIEKVNRIIAAEEPLLRSFTIEFDEEISPEEFAKEIIKNNPDIEIAEPVYIPEIQGEFIPNDSLITEQPMLKLIKAYEAWDLYTGDTNVVVGISDSGILQTHEDLAANIWINKNEIPDDSIDNDNNGYIDDYNGYNFTYLLDSTKPGNTLNTVEGHGTGTTGIASAICNNKIGVAGVGFKSKFFPMKTMSQNGKGIISGYESIIYSAQMGFKVLNLSWGGRGYSDMNQTIINYAVAHDVAIVAASGNHGTSDPFFPACYKGVMGVGVTDTNDLVIPMSGIGADVDIMAPGDYTRTTSNDGTYGRFCCTSGAAPIVAGQLALIRGLHPELNCLQAIEFARLCSDNIEAVNKKEIKKLIPNRINLLKSVTIDPMSIPAVRPLEYKYEAEGDADKIRFSIDDTIKFKILYKNYLGACNNLEFKLSTVGDSLNSIVVLDSLLTEESILAGEEFYCGDFRFTIEKFNNQRPFFRVDIKGDNYTDYFLIPFTPYVNYTTFSNDAIMISGGDNGRLGYTDPPASNQGDGFKQKGKNSLLFEGGLIISADSNKVLTQVRLVRNKSYSDFASVKPFIEPDQNTALINDSFAPDSTRLNIELENTIEPADRDLPCFRLYIKLRNKSQNILKNLAVAYFFDWDIGMGGEENSAFTWTEFLPVTMRDNPHSTAGIIARGDEFEKVGIAVNSNYPNSEPIFASFLNSETQGQAAFPLENQYRLLNSGTSVIYNDRGDIANIVGMKFTGELASGDSVAYEMSICISDSMKALRNSMWNFLDPYVSSVPFNNSIENIKIFPNPAEDIIEVNCDKIESCEIIDILGNSLGYIKNNNKGNFVIDLADYVPGIYMLKLRSNNSVIVKSIIKK